MGFGSYLSDLVSAAGDTAREAGRSVARWSGEAVESAYAAAQSAKSYVGTKLKETLADTLGVTKATSQSAGTAIDAGKEKVASLKAGIGKAVDKVMGKETEAPAPAPAPAPALVQPCPVEEAKRKQATRAERKALIEKGKNSPDPAVRESAAHLERDMDAVEEAKLSNHIYCIHDPAECNADTQCPPGFKDVSKDPKALKALGLTQGDLNSPGSNFRAAVFERQNPPFSAAEAGYVVVFKGTSSGNTEDWQNNFRQGLDTESPYYQRAVRIGERVKRATAKPGAPEVGFAGHSLGGGLASAAASAAGLRGNTFNAAGLHPNTVARYGGIPGDASGIQAYNVPGDPLTETNLHGVSIAGMKVSSPPLAAGESQRLDRALADASIPDGKDDTYFHSMPVVVRAIERRKGADQERLSAAGGPP